MKFVVPVLVGAIIGYVTNWIAIKMLFWPHEEKRFLGFHIPFTPGLIPKERNRIARKMGEVVGDYLLSEEVIKNWLLNNNLEEKVEKWIEFYVNNLKSEERSLKAFIFKSNDEIVDGIKKELTNFICVEIKREELKKLFMELIKDYLLTGTMNRLYETIDEKLEAFLYELAVSNEAENLLKNYIEDILVKLTNEKRRLKDIIPEDLVYAVKRSIKKHDEFIVRILKDLLEDPSVEKKIKTSIVNLLSQHMSRIVSFFISPETITNIVYIKLKEYVNSQEFNQNVIYVVSTLIDRILETRVSTVTEGIVSNLGKEKILEISREIMENLSNRKSIGNIINIISENIKKKEKEILNNLIEIISQDIERILNSPELYGKIFNFLDKLVENILERPVSYVAKSLDENFVIKVAELIVDLLYKFLENKLPMLLKLFNVSKVVEEEINKYDVAFTEELILHIVQKELKVITWLGGLLGGIIGLLTPLLQGIKWL